MDLAVANAYSDNVSILLNNGDGTFAAKVDYGTGNGPYSVFSSDLDGDGDMDLAVANMGSDNVSILLNNSNGTFAGKVDYGAGYGPYSVFSSDLDGDGDMDLAVANGYSDNVSVLLNNNSSAVPVPDLPETYSMTVKSVAIDDKLEVRYALPVKATIKLRVYDIKGAKIKEITEEKAAGYHSREIDMKGRPKGVYFLKIEANGFTKTSKSVLM
jgi:ankyrin repeat protein